LEKILVAPNGWKHLQQADAEPGMSSRLFSGNQPYFLVVGGFAPGKNLAVVARAVEGILNPGFRVVVVGGANSAVFAQVAMSERFVMAGRISDGTLKSLYSGALALIFPSLYEGFGLPLLEAMACNCPVIASDIPSTREIAGNVPTYFDPANADQLSTIMLDYFRAQPGSSAFGKAAAERLAEYDWLASAKSILKAISSFEGTRSKP
jgi:glycosyltransferase involved in cell wall biosynthesis